MSKPVFKRRSLACRRSPVPRLVAVGVVGRRRYGSTSVFHSFTGLRPLWGKQVIDGHRRNQANRATTRQMNGSFPNIALLWLAASRTLEWTASPGTGWSQGVFDIGKGLKTHCRPPLQPPTNEKRHVVGTDPEAAPSFNDILSNPPLLPEPHLNVFRSGRGPFSVPHRCDRCANAA